jgi:uncharacterized protein YcbK (DUF882 family)
VIAAVVHYKLATALMSSWLGAASPVPLPAASIALALEVHAAMPVEVELYDANRKTSLVVVIERDGSTDAANAQRMAHAMRCWSGGEHVIAQKTLAMLVDVYERFGRPIEFVSGYRVRAGEPPKSPHRAARAIDFRISKVSLTDVRDYLWRTYTGVGIGWYPHKQFIHMDSRDRDQAWTFQPDGSNDYRPFWADLVRRPAQPRRIPGV